MNDFKRVTALILLLCSATFGVAEEKPVKICMYSPKLSITDFKSLKTKFDDYLTSRGNLTLQPFSSYASFENYLIKSSNYLAIMPGWLHSAITSRKPMDTLLIGSCNGVKNESFYFVFNKNKKFSSSEEVHIVTALDDRFADSIITRNQKFKKLKQKQFLRVSKDIDALMSLSFGIAAVDIVLVSKDVLDFYSERNAAYVKEWSLLPADELSSAIMVLVTEKSAKKDLREKANTILEMNKDKKGKGLMSLIAIDSWEKPKQEGESNEK